MALTLDFPHLGETCSSPGLPKSHRKLSWGPVLSHLEEGCAEAWPCPGLFLAEADTPGRECRGLFWKRER